MKLETFIVVCTVVAFLVFFGTIYAMTGNHDVWKGREAARIAASEQYNGGMLDISEPFAPVEVELSADGTRLWVNIGGRCVLRVSRIATKTVVRGAGRL